jgi:asparaginyl-tRNA synthetase
MASEKKIGQIISVSQIPPLDWTSPQIVEAFEAAVKHCSNPDLADITRIRTKVQQTISNTLIQKGFLHPPVQLFSPCSDPLNHETEVASMSYYGQTVTLSQSMIFAKMLTLALSNIDKVFWVSPNVRKEMNCRVEGRYATEFTQIDFESSQLDFDSCLSLIEEVVKAVVNTLADEEGETIARISGRRLQKMTEPMKRYDLDEEAKKHNCTQGEAEDIIIAQTTDHPFFLTNLKREAYDRRDDATGKYKNYDVLFPVVGEILSGGEREYTAERLTLRMNELGYNLEYFEPVLRVARDHGLKSSAGAGFGIERITRAILLLPDIQSVYPFPRIPEKPITF